MEVVELQVSETFYKTSLSTLEAGRELSPMMATLCSLCCGSGETTASSAARAPPFWVGSAGPWVFIDRDSVPWRHILN